MEPNPSSIVLAAIALLPTGLAVRASLRLIYGARGPETNDLAYYLVTVVSWVMVVMSVVVIALTTLGFSIVLVAIIGYAILDLVLARRSQAREMAWSLISTAAAGRQPLQLAADLGRERFQGGTRRQFEAFADDIAKGTETTTAIARHKGVFPRYAQSLAALGKDGDLGVMGVTGLGEAAPNEIWSRITGRLGYLLMLGIAMTTILTFVFLMIIPQFRAIFDEFELELPPMTESLIATAEIIQLSLIGVLLVQAVALTVLGLFIMWVLYLLGFHPLRPISDKLFFSRHRSQVMRLLAIAAERGQTFESALDRLSTGSPRYDCYAITSRMRRAMRSAESGQDWRLALENAGLLRPGESPLLHAAERAGNLPWAFNALANQAVNRSLFRWQAVSQTVFPLIIVLLGGIIAWIVIGLFIPLVKLIEAMS